METNQKRVINLKQIEEAIDEENRTVEIAFASQFPVTRSINGTVYQEILLCAPENVDMSRINTPGMCPLLIEHDSNRQIGVVLTGTVNADKVCRAVVQIDDASTATLIFNMIRKGMRQGISVGYNILDYYIDGDSIMVTRWQPYEISSVSSAADYLGSGIGRSLNSNSEIILKEETNMEQEKEEAIESTEREEEIESNPQEEVETESDTEESHAPEEMEVEQERSIPSIDVIVDADKESLNKDVESKRVRELESIALVMNLDTTEAIKSCLSVEEFKRSLLNNENKTIDKEVKQMEKQSLIKLAMSGERSIEDHGFTRGARGYEVDLNDLAFQRGVNDTTSTVTAAGAVKTKTADFYIRTLLANSVLATLPVTVYGGLQGLGNLAVPKSTGVAPAAKFYGEDEPLELSVAGFDKVTLTPRHFGFGVAITKQMRLSNGDIETFVTDEILRYASNGLEQEVFSYLTANAPVVTTAAADTITVEDIQSAIAALGEKNVDVSNCVAVVSPRMLAKLRQVRVLDNVAGVAAVSGHRYDMWLNDEVRVIESTLLPYDDTIFIGDFRSLMIANWQQGQELDFDETTKRSEQTLIVWSHQWLDFKIARNEDFVQIKLKAATPPASK